MNRVNVPAQHHLLKARQAAATRAPTAARPIAADTVVPADVQTVDPAPAAASPAAAAETTPEAQPAAATPVAATRSPQAAPAPAATSPAPLVDSLLGNAAPVVVTTTPAAAPRVVATTAPRAATTPVAAAIVPAVATSATYSIVSVSQAFGTGVRPTFVSLTPVSSSATSTATSSANSTGSMPAGSGSVVGIVVGSLVGVVVLATLVGYGWRKRWGRKSLDDGAAEYYDKDDLRRQSVRLDDGPGGYGSNRPASMLPMAQYAIPGLGRSNTTSSFLHASPPLGYPASPPLGSVPSFSPGQVVPTSNGPPSPVFTNHNYIPSGPPSPQLASFANAQTNGSGGGYGWGGGEGMDMYGSYPVSTTQLDSLDRGLYRPQQFQQYQVQQAQHAQEQELRERLQYQQHQQAHYASGIATPLPHSPLASSFDNAPAHFAQSAEPSTYSHQSVSQSVSQSQDQSQSPSRSGTPENSNPQQSYFSHSSPPARASPPRIVVSEEEGYNGVGGLMMGGRGELGVRNGSEEEEDGYGGYA